MKVAVTDICYGDSGKALNEQRILTHRLYLPEGERYHSIVRFGGGCNSGQSWQHEGKDYVAHLLPPGADDPALFKAVLGWCVVNPDKLLEEIESLREAGFKVTPETHGISGRAQMTLMHHLESELRQESGKRSYGTTKSGIGPTYGDIVTKRGCTFAEFVGPNFEAWVEEWKWHIERALGRKIDVKEFVGRYERHREVLREFLMNEAWFWRTYGDKNMVIAGHQGMGLDPVYGTRPFTSSGPQRLPANAYRLGLTKILPSSVGKRRFMTAMPEEEQKKLRGKVEDVDGEFGKTTKRPRNIGNPDLVLWRYNIAIGGIEAMIYGKWDKLRECAVKTGRNTIPVCVAYEYDGKILRDPPDDQFELLKCRPVYEEWPISGEDISNIREEKDLPDLDRAFLDRLRDELGVDWDIVSVGPGTDDFIINRERVSGRF